MIRKTVLWMAAVMLAGMLLACTSPDRTTEAHEPGRLPNLIFSTLGTETSTKENPAWLEKKPQNNTPSTSVDVHLFVDGSLSMRGYLAYAGSTYERMITSLPSVCINAFEDYDFNAYKLFEDVYTMKDASQDFKAIGDDYVDYVYKRDFYGTEMAVRSGEVRAADKERSDFAKIIEKIKAINPKIETNGAGNDLYIIVSDFVPQNSQDIDFYHFNSKLYTEMLNHDLCCGIAGFMSDFYGDVACLDVNGRRTEFAYDGEMPFYIMVVGETRNVTELMDAMADWIDHFELDEQDYGIFITDGQSPRNTAAGDMATVVWEKSAYPGLVSKQETESMVSKALLSSNACKRGETLTYAMAYNIFPLDQYMKSDALTGAIHFALPYALSPASSINIKDEDWTLDYRMTVVRGERAMDTVQIQEIAADHEGNMVLPLDMSVAAFEYIYEPRMPRIEKGQTLARVQKNTWEQRTAEYLGAMTPNTVCPEDMFVFAGEGYVKDGEVIIPVTLDTSLMENEMPYLVSVSITAAPRITTQPLESWIDGWDLANRDYAAWINDPQGLSKGKTPGLSEALKALQGNRIYDDGIFTRQINLVVNKGETLAPEGVLDWAEQQAAEAKLEADAQETDKKKDGGSIFDIFKKGDDK